MHHFRRSPSGGLTGSAAGGDFSFGEALGHDTTPPTAGAVRPGSAAHRWRLVITADSMHPWLNLLGADDRLSIDGKDLSQTSGRCD